MMLSMVGEPSEIDFFKFQLAKDLGKTIGEIDGMTHREYFEWQAWYTASAVKGSERSVI